MGEGERRDARALLKSFYEKQDQRMAEHRATRTPERDAEVRRTIDKFASRLVVTKTGPNEYDLTAVETSGPAAARDRLSLTKSALMTLPEGCWIVSGISHNDGTPVLTAQIGNVESRAELWARMKSLNAEGRLYYVLPDEAALNVHLEKWSKIRAAAAQRERRVS